MRRVFFIRCPYKEDSSHCHVVIILPIRKILALKEGQTVQQRKECCMKRQEGDWKDNQLVIDGYGCQYRQLVDLQLLYDFLADFFTKLGVNGTTPPFVFSFDGQEADDERGVSGFVIFQNSNDGGYSFGHASVHTFPDKGYISVDVLAVGQILDFEKAMGLIKSTYDAEKYERNTTHRGPDDSAPQAA